MLLQRKAFILSAIVSAVLIGCGSSGNNNSSSDYSTSLKGQFVDAPVENLDYVIGNQAGVTDNDGYFTYNSSDENITFKVGNLILGTFELKNIHNGKAFPADLVGVDVNNTTNDNLIKIIRFLQSIDDDNNPDNGIYISDNIKTQINNLLENNSTYNQDFLDNNLSVIKSLVESLNKKFVLEREARNNYAKTLIALGYTPTKMPFITVWQVSSTDKKITISINPNYEYNYTVDWGDGNISKDVTDNITHTYPKEGNWTVKISGDFPAIYFYYNADRGKLISVNKWGDIKWKSFRSAFYGCYNFNINSTDTPDLSEVKDMSRVFYHCYKLNSNINDWNVSNVTDMSYMFDDATSFNQPLNNWNVSNVTDMSYMFYSASSFNQPLNDWNVSNVTDMSGMFDDATSFNQPLNDWNVSNVIDMSDMFREASLFNQPLNDWNVSNVTDMSYMFDDATSFNQPLNNWNVSNVIDMSDMFYSASSFNQPLNNWNVSNVTDMSYMFEGASSFNQPLNDWNVSNVINMSGMFEGASSFNQPLDDWNVSNVKFMEYMFREASLFNQPLNDWNVSNVINMSGMFYSASSFNQPLDDWNVSNVKYMDYMFYNASSFDKNISMWDVSNVQSHTNFATNSPIDGTNKMPHFSNP